MKVARQPDTSASCTPGYWSVRASLRHEEAARPTALSALASSCTSASSAHAPCESIPLQEGKHAITLEKGTNRSSGSCLKVLTCPCWFHFDFFEALCLTFLFLVAKHMAPSFLIPSSVATAFCKFPHQFPWPSMASTRQCFLIFRSSISLIECELVCYDKVRRNMKRKTIIDQENNESNHLRKFWIIIPGWELWKPESKKNYLNQNDMSFNRKITGKRTL